MTLSAILHDRSWSSLSLASTALGFPTFGHSLSGTKLIDCNSPLPLLKARQKVVDDPIGTRLNESDSANKFFQAA